MAWSLLDSSHDDDDGDDDEEDYNNDRTDFQNTWEVMSLVTHAYMICLVAPFLQSELYFLLPYVSFSLSADARRRLR